MNNYTSEKTQQQASNWVYLALRRGILKGYLKPNERLVEASLAKEFNVSRTPIREAIKRLQSDGLVTAEWGASVKGIDHQEIHEIGQLRIALEKLALELAIERITESELEALWECVRCMDETTKNSDWNSVGHYNRKLHFGLVKSSSNRYLEMVFESIMNKMNMVWESLPPDFERMKKSQEGHRKILVALKEKNLKIAQKEVAVHITAVTKVFSKALERTANRFKRLSEFAKQAKNGRL